MAEIIKAPRFDEPSHAFGATPEEVKAGLRLVELAIAGRTDVVQVGYIASTQVSDFRPWMRVKGKKTDMRVAVELAARA